MAKKKAMTEGKSLASEYAPMKWGCAVNQVPQIVFDMAIAYCMTAPDAPPVFVTDGAHGEPLYHKETVMRASAFCAGWELAAGAAKKGGFKFVVSRKKNTPKRAKK